MPLFAWILAAALVAQQDVKVSQTLSAVKIAVGETVTLQIDVQTAGAAPESIDVPPLPGTLRVVASQSSNQLSVTMAGGRMRVAQRHVILMASAPGVYDIPATTVRVNGQQYLTNRVRLTVESSVGATGAVTGSSANDGVRLRVRLSPDTVYVGEQAILEVEALFPRDLRQRQSRPASFDTPSPPGFWVIDQVGGLVGDVRLVDGIVYETQTYRRAYFGLEAGLYSLSPARLRYELRRAYLSAPESRELVSDSPRITVLPLPMTGRPTSFTGAVGRYTMQASLSPSRVAAGDAAVLAVEIEGTGNVKALPPPRLPDLPGVEIYPPTEESVLDASGLEIHGVKRFSWVLVPGRRGLLEPGSIEYAFFDPADERYAVARSAPLTLDVVSGPASTRPDTALRPIHDRAGGEALGWVRSEAFVLLQAMPLLLVVGALIGRRMREGPGAERRRARQERNAALAEIRAAAVTDPDRVFLGRLATWVRSGTAGIADVPEVRTTPAERVKDVLVAAGIPVSAATRAAALLRRLDNARFAQQPVPFAERGAMIDEAAAVVSRIGRESRRTGSARAATAAGVALLAAAMSSSASAQSSARAQGVEAYLRADYVTAVDAFERHAASAPRDAGAWYNLGNAYHGAGRRGAAVWAWRRAIEASPRHRDARYNLRATGALPALAGAPPPFTPTEAETALGLALAWWIGAIAAAFRILRGSRTAARVAFAAIVSGLLLGMAGLPGIVRSARAIALVEAPLFAGPDRRAEPTLTLAPGTPVRVLAERNEWLLLRTLDEADGWGEARRFGTL
jgi:tetratricopeptide (TPR) repeat protein